MSNQNQGHDSGRSGTQNRGFASMSDADQRAIARMGGTAVSENREHMAQIGRKGGEASAEARASIRNAAQSGKAKSASSGMAESRNESTQRPTSSTQTGDSARSERDRDA